MFKILLLSCLFQFCFIVITHPWDQISKADGNWQKLHKQFVSTTLKKGKQIHLIFFEWAATGVSTWQEHYGNLSAVNYGISVTELNN